MEKKIYLPVLITAIAVFVLFTAFRKNESPVRQVLEYKNIVMYRKIDKDWIKEDDNKSFNYPIEQKFKELGEQGWELVASETISDSFVYQGDPNENFETSASFAGYTNDIVYHFKRAK